MFRAEDKLTVGQLVPLATSATPKFVNYIILLPNEFVK